MRNWWFNFKKDLKTNLIVFGVDAIVCTSLFLILYFVAFGPTLYGGCNAATISLALALAVFIFPVLGRLGMFNTLAYGFSSLGYIFFMPKKKRPYHDLVEYTNAHNEKVKNAPHYFVCTFTVFLAFVILLIVFEILYNTSVH